MLYYGWSVLKVDLVLRNKFYEKVLQRVIKLSEEIKNANITNILMDVLSEYESVEEDDIINFNNLMPDFFKKDIKKLYKKNGIFFHSLNKKVNPIFDL